MSLVIHSYLHLGNFHFGLSNLRQASFQSFALGGVEGSPLCEGDSVAVDVIQKVFGGHVIGTPRLLDKVNAQFADRHVNHHDVLQDDWSNVIRNVQLGQKHRGHRVQSFFWPRCQPVDHTVVHLRQ